MTPSTRILLDPSRPVVADCRWCCERRVGFGDKLVAVGALQALQGAGFALSVSSNPADGDLFSASGLRRFDGGEPTAQGLPMRDHPMAIPIGMTNEEADDFDAYEAIHPVHRVLWGLGLQAYAPPSPEVHLSFSANLVHRKGTLWMPLEVSRAPHRIHPAEWAEVLSDHDMPKPIRALAAVSDLPHVRPIVEAVSSILRQPIPILYTATVREWGMAVESSAYAVTPNSGGLWMALATSTPCLCVQRELSAPHQRMWQAREWWRECLSVVTLPA